jgi:hypothetical protein
MTTKENHAAWKRAYRIANRERVRATQRKSYWKNRKRALDWYYQNQEHVKERGRLYRERVRLDAFSHYGGLVCACCGLTEPTFLTLGHINADGAAHRRSLFGNAKQGGYAFYQWLKQNNYPPLPLRVECFNCNCSKHYRNNGKCVHELNLTTQ